MSEKNLKELETTNKTNEIQKNIFEIQVSEIGGLRYSTLKFGTITEEFPRQIITSTNIGHVENFEDDVNLNTKTLQVFLNLNPSEFDILETRSIRNKKNRARNLLADTSKIGWLFIKNIFSSSRITKKRIIESIKLQENMECNIKTLHIPRNLKPTIALELIKEYPHSVVYIDMGDTPSHFKEIYKECIKARIKVICFVIRRPSQKNIENYNFIAKRTGDMVIRIATQFPKRSDIVNDRALSFFYYILGFDGYAYRGGQKPYNTSIENISTYRIGMYRFENIMNFSECGCEAHKGTTPFDKANEYYNEDKSSIPTSIHDHLEINEDFKIIRKKLVEKILDIGTLKADIDFDSMFEALMEREASNEND